MNIVCVMKQDTKAQLSSLLKKLHAERDQHLAAIEEIDSVLESFGGDAGAPVKRRGPGRPRGSKNTKKKTKKKSSKKKTGKRAGRKGRGLKKGGSRVQGVKQTLEEALTGSPQSPAQLQDKVSAKLGHDVSVATQLHMLKREGKAKSVGRGQWVKG